MTRKEQKEERRKIILMTALKLFVERGFHETKISDIADAVPMSVGLLFHYFESKEVLLKELVTMGVQYTGHVSKVKARDPSDFFVTFLRQLFEYSTVQPWVFNMFVLMGQARKTGMPEEVRAIAETIHTAEDTSRIIRKGQKEGLFRKGDALQLSITFWAAVQGIMEEMAVNKDYKAPDPEWLVAIILGNNDHKREKK
ncbi:MAG: TetR/AcrR family transcriptional regulator [Lachnospiraceae bacterium]|nr:TetR/AcrR family transcriptional regulator [Lachnospiraceae bacterium]